MNDAKETGLLWEDLALAGAMRRRLDKSDLL